MIDTCQASSMYEKFYSPNILAMASSLVGEDSLSVRHTYIFLNILIQKKSQMSILKESRIHVY